MKRLLTLTSALIALLCSKAAMAEYGLNMTQGITEVSKDIYDLHMMVFWVCVVIGIVVFGAMFYSIVAHRKSKGHKAAHFHESTTVEFIWTGVPILILIAMAIPATKTLIDIEVLDKADMTIKVTGHQWKWQYDYPVEGISFISNLSQSSKDVMDDREHVANDKHKEHGSPAEREALDASGDIYLLSVDNHLVIPVDTTVRFLITSNDVIHNWWVPAFAVKQDANPGFINDAWARPTEIGTYRGQCAELCGTKHGFMPIVVDVVSKADYAAWVAEQQGVAAAAVEAATQTWSEEDLMAQGETLYNTNCAGCHMTDGSGGYGPAIKGSSIANGDAADHLNIVINGKNGMPSFKMLGDADLAAVITYERRAFGNTGSVVQPADATSAR
ncbi:MAG: cytochrome c oxidase subunit II [Gammaproteobacteria bacterium]